MYKESIVINDLILRVGNIDNRHEELVAVLTSHGFSIASAEIFPKIYKAGDELTLKKDFVAAKNELIASAIIVPNMTIPLGTKGSIKEITDNTVKVAFNYTGNAKAYDMINAKECVHSFLVEDIEVPISYFI